MSDTTGPEVDRRKVRMGLALVTLVVLVALVLAFVIDTAIGRSVMLAIALVGIVRAFLLSRALRTEA
jgi:hypothetical protein